MTKPFPVLATDQQAQDFVADPSVDLSDYDLSDMVPVRKFWTRHEAQPKSKAVHLRLSDALLSEIKQRAAQAGLPVLPLMRVAMERGMRMGERHIRITSGARSQCKRGQA